MFPGTRGGRVRPGRPMSVAAIMVGLAMLAFVAVILYSGLAPYPFSLFFVVFLVAVLAVIGYHAYNLFARRGAPLYEVDVEGGRADPDFDDRLRDLEKLRREGLITKAEYEKKRKQIMSERW